MGGREEQARLRRPALREAARLLCLRGRPSSLSLRMQRPSPPHLFLTVRFQDLTRMEGVWKGGARGTRPFAQSRFRPRTPVHTRTHHGGLLQELEAGFKRHLLQRG